MSVLKNWPNSAKTCWENVCPNLWQCFPQKDILCSFHAAKRPPVVCFCLSWWFCCLLFYRQSNEDKLNYSAQIQLWNYLQSFRLSQFWWSSNLPNLPTSTRALFSILIVLALGSQFWKFASDLQNKGKVEESFWKQQYKCVQDKIAQFC